LRLIDSCITQLQAQGPSRTCNESKEEEDGVCATHRSVPLAVDTYVCRCRQIRRCRQRGLLTLAVDTYVTLAVDTYTAALSSLPARMRAGRSQEAESLRASFTEMCSGTKAGSYSRRMDSCITQLKAQGPSSNCNESKEVFSGSFQEHPRARFATPPPRARRDRRRGV